jgi:3',5'-cyclic AMP phosphodiesterase CpdA
VVANAADHRAYTAALSGHVTKTSSKTRLTLRTVSGRSNSIQLKPEFQRTRAMQEPEVFVVMPFGIKHFSLNHEAVEMNFDRVYKDLIYPAVESAGLRVNRIDELAMPGIITEQYLQRLFEAAIVIADVTMPNGNVFYELGIRHAVSTGLTLLIAHEGTPLPFDIAHLRVYFYKRHRLETSRGLLVSALASRVDETVNPVRKFLQKLGQATSATDGAAFAQDLASRVLRAKTVEQLIGIWGWAKNQSPLPPLTLLQLAERLAEFDEWTTSISVLKIAAQLRPLDFEIHRTLGWHLRHLGGERESEALAELELALQLNPNDPETLGMIGGIFKRRGDFHAAAKTYGHAGAVAPTSMYVQVNRAATLVLAAPTAPAAGLKLYRKLLVQLEAATESSSDPWSEVVAGEAAFALGRDSVAVDHFRRAKALTKTGQELKSAAGQLELFQKVGFRTNQAEIMVRTLRDMIALGSVNTTAGSAAEPVQRVAPYTPIFLHLSDTHFGSKPGKDGAIEMHRFVSGDYEKSLHEHFLDEFCSKRAHFTHDHSRIVLIISGDLTYQASDEEFQRVQEFLEKLCDSLKIPKERVILVPGNHDVHWPSAQIDRRRRFDNYVAFLHQFYGDALFRSRYPLIKWNLQVNGVRPAPEELISIYQTGGVTIMGLNSCVYETAQNHYGFIGGRQLDNVEKLLDDAGGSIADLRVAVLHHHLHPFPEPINNTHSDEQIWMDLSTIRDAGLVERRLERLGFDLVLHGHKHKPQLRETLVHEQSVGRASSRLIVCGTGSTGVNASELEHQTANHYSVIEVMRLPRTPGAELFSVEWREIALHPGAEWLTSKRWILHG